MVVELDEARLNRLVLKMENGCFEHISAKFIPSFRFGENGVPERPGQIAAFFRIPNFEN